MSFTERKTTSGMKRKRFSKTEMVNNSSVFGTSLSKVSRLFKGSDG